MLLKIIPISISTFVLKPDVLIELPQGGEKKLSKADFLIASSKRSGKNQNTKHSCRYGGGKCGGGALYNINTANLPRVELCILVYPCFFLSLKGGIEFENGSISYR